MDQSFELASTTPVSVEALREAAAAGIDSPLYRYFMQQAPGARAKTLAERLGDEETLEEHVEAIGDQSAKVFTLLSLFAETLGPKAEETTVPGHGTVTEVSVSDGPLSVHQNLLVEGTLVVAGDVTVGGQCVVGEEGRLFVLGTLYTPALASAGQVSIGVDLRAMFVELTNSERTLDVGEELDAFLLIQHGQRAAASSYSVGLHALLDGPASEVFLPTAIARDGSADWSAVARAARSGQDVFVPNYQPPEPGTHRLVSII